MARGVSRHASVRSAVAKPDCRCAESVIKRLACLRRYLSLLLRDMRTLLLFLLVLSVVSFTFACFGGDDGDGIDIEYSTTESSEEATTGTDEDGEDTTNGTEDDTTDDGDDDGEEEDELTPEEEAELQALRDQIEDNQRYIEKIPCIFLTCDFEKGTMCMYRSAGPDAHWSKLGPSAAEGPPDEDESELGKDDLPPITKDDIKDAVSAAKEGTLRDGDDDDDDYGFDPDDYALPDDFDDAAEGVEDAADDATDDVESAIEEAEAAQEAAEKAVAEAEEAAAEAEEKAQAAEEALAAADDAAAKAKESIPDLPFRKMLRQARGRRRRFRGRVSRTKRAAALPIFNYRFTVREGTFGNRITGAKPPSEYGSDGQYYAAAYLRAGQQASFEARVLRLTEPIKLLYDRYTAAQDILLEVCCINFDKPDEPECNHSPELILPGDRAWMPGEADCDVGTDAVEFRCTNLGMNQGACAVNNIHLDGEECPQLTSKFNAKSSRVAQFFADREPQPSERKRKRKHRRRQ